MNYSSAAMLISAERRRAVAEADAAFIRAMRLHPELEEAEKEFRRAVISGDKLRTEKALENKREIIQRLGYLPGDFEPEPKCADCGDSGYVAGKFCSCTRQKAAVSTGGELPPPYVFTNADMCIFGKKADEAVKSYEVMRAFCAKFPGTKTKNVLIMGRPGTGKTHLAACVANELLDKGCGVVFVSSFRFNDLCLKYHTSWGSDKTDYLNALLDCDLLIIDDLGSESILKNVTLEYLFTVIDERMRRGRHTMITTNLSPETLETRYSERTTSRLFSERLCLSIVMSGNDLRRSASARLVKP